MAKDEASPYEGGRTMRWLKVKQKDGSSRRRALAAADQRVALSTTGRR